MKKLNSHQVSPSNIENVPVVWILSTLGIVHLSISRVSIIYLQMGDNEKPMPHFPLCKGPLSLIQRSLD